jgi:hypothetical protein
MCKSATGKYQKLIGNEIKALARLFWTFEPNADGANLINTAYAPQPNESFNADANIGHGFAIFMANVGALRASRSGAG